MNSIEIMDVLNDMGARVLSSWLVDRCWESVDEEHFQTLVLGQGFLVVGRKFTTTTHMDFLQALLSVRHLVEDGVGYYLTYLQGSASMLTITLD